MKVKYKLMFAAPVLAFTMGACRATYQNTVKAVYSDKKILVENTSGEERLIDCSKKTKESAQLWKDMPYFKEGDTIQLKPVRALRDNYNGRRVFSTLDYQVLYPQDTMQIRRDIELIAKEKAAHTK